MVFRRNYSFDFPHEGHNQQPCLQKNRTFFWFQSTDFFRQNMDTSKIESFLLTFVDSQSYFSLEI